MRYILEPLVEHEVWPKDFSIHRAPSTFSCAQGTSVHMAWAPNFRSSHHSFRPGKKESDITWCPCHGGLNQILFGYMLWRGSKINDPEVPYLPWHEAVKTQGRQKLHPQKPDWSHKGYQSPSPASLDNHLQVYSLPLSERYRSECPRRQRTWISRKLDVILLGSNSSFSLNTYLDKIEFVLPGKGSIHCWRTLGPFMGNGPAVPPIFPGVQAPVMVSCGVAELPLGG